MSIMEFIDQTENEAQENQVSFDSLPDELIIVIFSRLSPEALVCGAAEVCVRWRKIARDAQLWELAELTFSKLDAEKFKKVITFAPLLYKLNYNMFDHFISDIFSTILSGCSVVKHLSFYPNHFVPVKQQLEILLHYQHHLEGISMFIDDSLMHLDPLCSGTVFDILRCMPHLQMLKLRGPILSFNIRGEEFKTGWECLREIDIRGVTVKHANSEWLGAWRLLICPLLKFRKHQLKKLVLPVDSFDSSREDTLVSDLQYCNVEDLTICEVSLEAIKHLANLKSLHILGMSSKSLAIWRSISDPLNYKQYFDWVSTTCQFSSVLNLTLESITDDERQLVSKVVAACENCVSLTVEGGNLSPHQLFEVIKAMPLLKVLNLHRQEVLKPGHLELIPSHLPYLITLNLRHNTLRGGILQFYRDNVQPKMPELQLESDWGSWNKYGGNPYKIVNVNPKSKRMSALNCNSVDEESPVKEKVQRLLSDTLCYESSDDYDD